MKILLCFSLLTTSLIIHSQTKELDFEFFNYGLNHCYFSNFKRDFKENKIDIFFENGTKEEIIAEYLRKKIKEDSIDYVEIKRIDRGPDFVNDRGNSLSQYYMFSEFLRKGLDYNFNENSLINQESKHNLDNKKINSFIAGAYLRNGYKINDTIYKISISVSSKPKHCYSLLKKTNSTNILYDITGEKINDNILYNPTSTVYFNPSDELKEYLKMIKDVPKIMERCKAYMTEIFDENIANKKKRKNKVKAKKELIDFKTNFEKNLSKRNLEDIEIVKRLLKEKIK